MMMAFKTQAHHRPRSLDPARSQVSRRWRSIALSCPQLWTNWPRYHPHEHWTDICYARSQEVPLDLRLRVDQRALQASTTAGRNLALREIHRAKTLKVDVPEYLYLREGMAIFVDILKALAVTEAPLLEALLLSPYQKIQEPQNLFRGKALPHLQFAFIRNVEFNPSSKIWPEGLRVLDMRNACAWSDVDEMVEFFRSIPNLEDLTYQYYDVFDDAPRLIDYSRSQKYPLRSIRLPRLTRFQLENDSGERYHLGGSTFLPGITLFNYCALPPSVILHIKSDRLAAIDVNDPMNPHTLIGVCAENCLLGVEAFQAHFADAAARGQSYDVVTITNRIIIPDTARQVSDCSGLPVALRLVIPHISMMDRVSNLACSLYLSLPVFRGAKELHILRNNNICPPFLHLLPDLVALHTLMLSRDAVKDLAVGPRFATIAARFPSLETIRLANFDCEDNVRAQLAPELASGQFEDGLLSNLVECYEAGLCRNWKLLEFKVCRNVESAIEKIKGEARLRHFNEQVQITVVPSTYGKEEPNKDQPLH